VFFLTACKFEYRAANGKMDLLTKIGRVLGIAACAIAGVYGGLGALPYSSSLPFIVAIHAAKMCVSLQHHARVTKANDIDAVLKSAFLDEVSSIADSITALLCGHFAVSFGGLVVRTSWIGID
jgi:hypothetical protein